MRVLVTGGAGFIGRHVVRKLAEEGHGVSVLDALLPGEAVVAAVTKSGGQVHAVDVRDAARVAEACEGQEVILHLAAMASVPECNARPTEAFEVNAWATSRFLEVARAAGVRRFVFASSAAVYGAGGQSRLTEETPTCPISPYGATKLAAEQFGLTCAGCYGQDFISARIFNCYGPGQPRYVLHDFVRKLNHDPRELKILGTGCTVRDFCHVSDTASGLIKLLEAPELKYRVYNIAGDSVISIRELATLLLELSQLRETRIVTTEASWSGDAQATIADTSRLREIGWAPRVPLEQGLAEYLRLYARFGCHA